MKIKLLLVLFLSLFFIGLVNAAEEKKVVRVAISNQNFSTYDHSSIKISSVSPIKIIDMLQNSQLEPIEENKIIKITIQNELLNVYADNKLKYENLQGPLVFGSNSELEVVELNRKGIPAK